jgi:signal transduction histidine kinase
LTLKGALLGWARLTLRTTGEDDGPGISAEIQSRILDAFFTTRPTGKGNGLGPSISCNIVVHKQREEIKVTSKPGTTCFAIRLPMQVKAG